MPDHLHALPAGHRLGEYRIDHVLGSGGFGITYYTRDIHLDKPVAIKEYLPNEFALRTGAITVKPKSSADQDDYQWGLERFLDEARALARFDHPHLNKVHRFFEDNGTAYIVLEYIEGETLSQVLKREGRLDQVRLRRLLDELLSGLEEVHAAGYVHRDLKPGNIMLRADGSSVLLDFGAARQVVGQRSKSITSILTPGYAPLEQYDQKAEDVGPWSDLYALGMVAYRCVSGIGDGGIPDAVARARLERKDETDQDLAPTIEVGKDRYDERLLKAVDWAIRVGEDQRPQSVAALQEVLGCPQWQGHKAEEARLEENRRFAAAFGRDASPDGADADGITDLHYAAAANLPGLVEFLLDAGAEIDARMYEDKKPLSEESKRRLRELTKTNRFNDGSRDGGAPLHFAAWKNAREAAELLLARGADVNAKRNDGGTPLHLAAWKNAREAAELLLARGADVHAKINDGGTPLHHAAWKNAREAAELLLARGADVHAKDDDGWTPLHNAAQTNAREAAELLLARGADVHAKSDNGSTPLHIAVGNNARGAAELLIARGADVHAKNKYGTTPLHVAARANARATAELLLARGADVNAKEENGGTPLHHAAWENAREAAELLIARGADVHAKDDDGWTPLHHAAWENAREAAELLIARGADVNAKSDDGGTPLHFAAWNNAREAAEFLIARGAKVNARTNKGWMPLHLATHENAREAAELLITRGAKVNAEGNNGWTPLHFAARGNARKAAELLIARGADVNAMDNFGKTPRDVAEDEGHSELARLLR